MVSAAFPAALTLNLEMHMNEEPIGDFWEGLGHATAFVLVLLGGAVFGLALALCRFVSYLLGSRKTDRAATAVSDHFVESADYEMHESIAFEPSMPRTILLQDVGYLTLWAYPMARLVKRQLRLTNPTFAEKAGAQTLPLPPLQWPDGVPLRSLEDLTIQQTRLYVSSELNGGCEPLEPLEPLAVAGTQQQAATGETPRTLADQVLAPAVVISPPATTASVRVTRVDYEKALEHAVGRLGYAGIVNRTLESGVIQQFAVDVETAEGTRRFHGADLERAVKEAEVSVGQMIDLRLVGYAPVNNGSGRTSQKRLYSVKVINP